MTSVSLCPTFLSHPLADGPLGCFYLLVVANCAVTHVAEKGSLVHWFYCFGEMLSGGVAGLDGIQFAVLTSASTSFSVTAMVIYASIHNGPGFSFLQIFTNICFFACIFDHTYWRKGNSSLWFLRKLILHIHISCVSCGEGGASFRNKPHHSETAKDRCEPCNHALSVILWAPLLMLVCVWARSRAPVDKPRRSSQWKDLCSVQHVWPSWKSTIYWK